MIERLPEIVERLKQKFGKTLVSVVLHGSTLKKAAAHDIDLLVIAKNLPEGWKERFSLIKPIKEEFLKKGTVLDIKLYTPSEFERAAKERNPLILSITERHEILQDSAKYFEETISNIRQVAAFECAYRAIKKERHHYEKKEALFRAKECIRALEMRTRKV